ncbi:hypothetical protein HID58_043229 [Brassica napus]|uniref:NAD(P)H dehydrogenase (quinone) n=1 Tax=Brassica napus TaxID=3708 RepID=A0ABQ8BHP0_BRANA|nr:hypothetical protein HID58_043229 [Brassica napus]
MSSSPPAGVEPGSMTIGPQGSNQCTLGVPEMLQEHVPKSDAPLITPRHLADADGFVCGFPTRFGMMSVQFKAFLDVTGGL